jgi:hypothetical protein
MPKKFEYLRYVLYYFGVYAIVRVLLDAPAAINLSAIIFALIWSAVTIYFEEE